ncbi:MAG TPA: hypothetical protein RMH85_26625 [Polyangiaceae bacterium LLY-WYZ-15_(1-7)]|nr:hypothetical protein [Sandaracinus sp.]HJK92338.1 hypothetical protein [Polyangiaceae bacterium LLY-WYZ-15_(1-7)]MBJ75032.1 hypothetical protein [Sandaracinus sp.]HJL01078.1 hypothetical protein [Polyangiaceae bacterium LLY-WYZ-15_(1-7)]HJL12080.1 hypothetical protein [Polyangiaceae bacterium LLY-WYZ-15_(1-7)]
MRALLRSGLTAAVLSLSFASGCIIVDDDDDECFDDFDCPSGFFCSAGGSCFAEDLGVPLYDACFVVDDCDLNADRCQAITADWPDGLSSTNNICTIECFDSSDCPISANGLQGTCASLGMGGTFVCYESCVTRGDCAAGFDCGDIGTGDTVCLPR